MWMIKSCSAPEGSRRLQQGSSTAVRLLSDSLWYSVQAGEHFKKLHCNEILKVLRRAYSNWQKDNRSLHLGCVIITYGKTFWSVWIMSSLALMWVLLFVCVCASPSLWWSVFSPSLSVNYSCYSLKQLPIHLILIVSVSSSFSLFVYNELGVIHHFKLKQTLFFLSMHWKHFLEVLFSSQTRVTIASLITPLFLNCHRKPAFFPRLVN